MKAERQKRGRKKGDRGHCYFCWQPGHNKRTCPKRFTNGR
jgi:hypothetical protein